MVRAVTRKIDYDQPDIGVIEEAAACLAGGGIIAAPTDTRYGLLVRADRNEELIRLYEVKGRDISLPTALFVRDLVAAAECGELNRQAEKLAEAFLPGPLTLVLKSVRDWGSPRVSGGKIGLRLSPAPVIRKIMENVPFPLSATSANISGEPDPAMIEDVRRSFGDKIDMYLDAGRVENPVSTVVDCSGSTIRIVRQGAVPANEIDNVAGRMDP